MSQENVMSEQNAVAEGPNIVQRAVAEAIGTFFFVFTIVCAVLLAGDMAPLAIGTSLMVMIFALGHVSGGHFNPAVTLAVFLRGRIEARDIGPYVGAQLAGALVAALIGLWIFSDELGTAPDALSGKAIAVALVVEFLFTFALAFVVLNVATSRNHPDNNFYGLAIGFTVLAGAYAVGALSGGAFNPAVAFGISIATLTNWANIWIFLVANLGGAVAAAYAFRFLNPDDL